MSFNTIEIHRDYQIVNGYVQVPPNDESTKTSVTIEDGLALFSGSTIVQLSPGSKLTTGRSRGTSTVFLRLAGRAVG